MDKILCFILCFSYSFLFAQQVDIQFDGIEGAPSELQVCGAPQTVRVLIETNGQTFQNVQATLTLLDGIQFDGLDIGQSSVGIVLTNNDIQEPTFTIPTLSSEPIELAYRIKLDCDIIDALSTNGNLIVEDTWNFTAQNLDETIANSAYRNAINYPILNIQPQTVVNTAARSVVTTRSFQISNSSLGGQLDSFLYVSKVGSGLEILEIKANGVSKQIQKVANGTDTLNQVLLKLTDFVGNKKGEGNGNSDQVFDPNESVVIEETFKVVDCDLSTEGEHSAFWGCGQNLCQEVNENTFIRRPEGQATINLQLVEPNKITSPSYCNSAQTGFNLINTGTEDATFAGALRNIHIRIDFDQNGTIDSNGHILNEVIIAGQTIEITDNSFIDLKRPAFTQNIDGEGGLEDLDGDGYFNDLAIGESVEVLVRADFSCAETSSKDQCANDRGVQFAATIQHDNACQSGLEFSNSSFYNVQNRMVFVDSEHPSDVFAESGTFPFTLSFQRSVINFFQNNPNKRFLIKIKKPNGLTIDVNALNFVARTTGNTFETEIIKNDADSLILNANIGSSNLFSGIFDLEFNAAVSCEASTGIIQIPTEISLENPDCDCSHTWFCGSVKGPFIHKEEPTCTLTTTEQCENGIRTTGFEANRTTFGFQDASFTTPIAAENANTKAALALDSVTLKLSGLVGPGTTSNDVRFEFWHDNINPFNSRAIFNIESGQIRIKKGSTETVLPLTKELFTQSLQQNKRTITLEAETLLNNQRITLETGDSISIQVFTTINPQGSMNVQLSQIPNFRAGIFVQNGSTELTCENFGADFKVGKFNVFYSRPTGSEMPQGCQTTVLEYLLLTENNFYSANFPNEFRPFIAIDSLHLQFDPSLIENYQRVKLELKIENHVVNGNNFIEIPFNSFKDGVFALSLKDSIQKIPLNKVISDGIGALRLTLVPNCNSVQNPEPLEFDPTWFYTTNLHTENFSVPTLVQDQQGSTVEISYRNPPEAALRPETRPKVVATKNEVVWEFSYCNVSNVADIGTFFINLHNLGNNVTIQKVEDISNLNNIQTVATNTIQSGLYFIENNLLKNNGQNADNEFCRTYRITAQLTDCKENLIKVLAGWRCEVLPKNTSLSAFDDCAFDELNLSAQVPDAAINASIVRQPADLDEVCSTNSISILIKNVATVDLVDLSVDITLPSAGMDFLPNNFTFAYPANTTPRQVAKAPIFVGTTAAGNVYRFEDISYFGGSFNALEGFEANNTIPDNQLMINFDFTTDCGMLEGSVIRYSAVGEQFCGEKTSVVSGETFPFKVKQTEPQSSVQYNLVTPTKIILEQSNIKTIRFEVFSISEAPTGSSNTLNIQLPAGIRYVPSSSENMGALPWVPGDPITSIENQRQILQWDLPAGQTIDQIAILEFDISNSFQDCALLNFTINAFTSSERTVSCNGENCQVSSISNLGGILGVPVNIFGQKLTVTNLEPSIACSNQTLELMLNGEITNTSNQDIPTFKAYYFIDNNQNQLFEPSDIVLQEETIEVLRSGENRIIRHQFGLPTTNSCDPISLFLDFDAENCDVTYFPFGIIPIQNAGEDTKFCIQADLRVDTSLGTMCSINDFEYAWQAIAPATNNMLSDLNIANPSVSFISKVSNRDSLPFVLTTNQNNQCSTRDTVYLIRGQQIELQDITDQTIRAGAEISIQANLNIGSNDIINYDWSPNIGLLQTTGKINTFSPPQTTTYQIKATASSGCSDTENFTIFVDRSCNLPDIQSQEIINGNTTGSIQLITDNIDEAIDINWTPDVGKAISPLFRTDLLPGIYTINLQNTAVDNCENSVSVALNNSTSTIARVREILNEDCGKQNGVVRLNPTTYTYAWNDGGTGNVRSDLSVGMYTITATSGSGEMYYLSAEVKSTIDIPVEHRVIQRPTNSNNGAVDLEIENPNAYTYNWSNGALVKNPANLSAGRHAVTITQISTGCQRIYSLVLGTSDELRILDLEVNNPSCFGTANGEVNFTVNLPADQALTATTEVVDQNGIPVEPDRLADGDYCIVIKDLNNQIIGGECFTVSAPTPINVTTSLFQDCAVNSSVLEIIPRGGTAPYSYFWTDKGSQESLIRTFNRTGFFEAVVMDSEKCQVRIPSIRVPSCEDQDCSGKPAGMPTQIVKSQCAEDQPIEICFDEFDPFFYERTSLSVNGTSFTQADGCQFNTFYSVSFQNLDFNSTNYRLDNFEINGESKNVTFNRLEALIDSIYLWTTDDWRYDEPNATLVSKTEPTFGGLLFFDAFNIPITVNLSTQAYPVGNQITLTDSVTNFIFFDKLNNCFDTTKVSVICGIDLSDDFEQSIALNEIVEVCFDPTEMDLGSEISSIRNICTSKSGASVDFKFYETCLEFGGSRLGRDTACIEVCGDVRCDTIQYDINVFTDVFIFRDSIFMDQQKRFCMATDIFPAPIKELKLVCPDQYAGKVSYKITENYCIEYVGDIPGIDTLCFALCDEQEHCDTVKLIIEALDFSQKPQLQNDIDSTFENQPIVINLQNNDIVVGTSDIELIEGENSGDIIINGDQSITYTPISGTCGVRDIFKYRQCNKYGCDTANVEVIIKCFDGVTIFKAFSPNGDGINDQFFISGLENFPNNILQVFNRWGDLVYETEGYENDWEGTWQGNRTLPDGTYFYILKLNDSTEQIKKGFVEMYR